MSRYAMICMALLLGLIVAGCSVINPGVAQLERYQQAQAAGEWQAIADDTPVGECPSGAAGCAQRYAIHGEANQQLAFDSRAPDAFCPPSVAKGRLESAVASFSKSEQFADGSLTPEAQVKLKELHVQALYCLAENAASIEQGKVLVRQGAALASGLPQADALFWQAINQLYLAQPGAGSDAQRCTAARLADQASSGARTAGVNGERIQTLSRVSHDAELVRRSIAGCVE